MLLTSQYEVLYNFSSLHDWLWDPWSDNSFEEKRTLDGSFELGGPQTKPEIFGGNIQGAVWLSELP